MELGGLLTAFNSLFKPIGDKLGLLTSSIDSLNSKVHKIESHITLLQDSNNKLNKEFKDYKESSEKVIFELKEYINKLFTTHTAKIEQTNKTIEDYKELSKQDSILLNNQINKVSLNQNNNTEQKLSALELIVEGNGKAIKIISDSQRLEGSNRKAGLQVVTNSFNSIDKKVNELNYTISNFKLSKKDILKVLQQNGNIDLMYNLVLTPRILPTNGVEGLIIIDAKDNKMKQFTKNKWKIL